MRKLTLLPLLLFFNAIIACANQTSTQETAKFIIAFKSAETQETVLTQKKETLQSWARLTDSHIEFVRTLSGHSWVVSVTTQSKVQFIEALQALENIKYVEEDQIIQISPIERPSGVRVH